MKHSADFDCNGFARLVRQKGLCEKLTDIETLFAEARPFFTEEFISKAAMIAGKQFLRGLFRDGFDDEDGILIRGAQIILPDPETGVPRAGYKQEAFWDLDDFEYLINDCRKRIKAETKKLRDLCRMAVDRFGRKEVQARFEFKLPLGRQAAAN